MTARKIIKTKTLARLEIERAFSKAKTITGITLGIGIGIGLATLTAIPPVIALVTPVLAWSWVHSARRKEVNRELKDNEDGTKYQTQRVANEILNDTRIQNKQRAAAIFGVTYALRQNCISQIVVGGSLYIANAVDLVGYVGKGVLFLAYASAGKKMPALFDSKELAWHNTCLDLFTRAGVTAPYKEEIEYCRKNSLLPAKLLVPKFA